jgi:hypothetical protein
MNTISTVNSIKTSIIMETLDKDFVGFAGTLKMIVKKVEERTGKFKNREKVLSGLAKFVHVNGTEFRARVVFLPFHIVEHVASDEVIELPLHRVKSTNSKNGFTFISEPVIPEDMWDSF